MNTKILSGEGTPEKQPQQGALGLAICSAIPIESLQALRKLDKLIFALSVRGDPIADEMRAALTDAVVPLAKDAARLKWLHTGGGSGARKEWGVCECEFDAHGKLLNAFWGFSDSSDVDAAMAAEFADEDPNLRMNRPDLSSPNVKVSNDRPEKE